MSSSVRDGKTLRSGWGVRRALAPDVERLAALEVASFSEPWDAGSLRDWLAADRGAAWVIEARPAAEPERFARAAGAEPPGLAGYALFQLLPEETELLRVAVAPARRGRGLARRLLESALAELAAAGRPLCHLEVRASNRAAVSLYGRLGFERSGRRPNYYADGEDALLFRRDAASMRDAAEGPPAG